MLPAAALGLGALAGTRRRTGVLLCVLALLPQLGALAQLPQAAVVAAGLARDERHDSARPHEWAQANLPFLRGDQPVTLMEAAPAGGQQYTDEAARWLRTHAYQGPILASAQGGDEVMFRSGLHLQRFITEGTNPHFQRELAVPGTYARWIVHKKGSSEGTLQPLVENGAPRGFALAFENEHFQVFERVPDG
jgi:hypothetical protein